MMNCLQYFAVSCEEVIIHLSMANSFYEMRSIKGNRGSCFYYNKMYNEYNFQDSLRSYVIEGFT